MFASLSGVPHHGVCGADSVPGFGPHGDCHRTVSGEWSAAPVDIERGTSVLVMSAAIGIMLSVSRFAVTSGNKNAIKQELDELPEDMHTANFSGQINEATK